MARRRQQVGDQTILDDEPDVAERKRPVDELAIAHVGDEHNPRRRARGQRLASGRDAVQARH
jgi:hypothetical protein